MAGSEPAPCPVRSPSSPVARRVDTVGTPLSGTTWKELRLRVLVSGHRGYVGTVLTRVLSHAGVEVVGLDCEMFRECDFGRTREQIPSFEIDVRDIEFT